MDVINENEKKRKRELGLESADEDESTQQQTENGGPSNKKIKLSEPSAKDQTTGQAKADKRREKRQRIKLENEKQKQKAEAKKIRNEVEKQTQEPDNAHNDDAVVRDTEEVEQIGETDDIEAMDTSGLVDDRESTARTTPEVTSPTMQSSTHHSISSSNSSIDPPSNINTENLTASNTKDITESDTPTSTATSEARPPKQKALNLPQIDPEELRARLKARIDLLREKRKADGPDGQPVKSRQDLLDARRKKSELRKQHKKEARIKAKEEEGRLNQERLQGSGSPLSSLDIFSPRVEQNSFSFGRVAFEDGAITDPTLSTSQIIKKKKGVQDLKGALTVAKKKEDRLKNMDDDKRQDIEEKDAWLSAKKKVHGERAKDDTSLLKKALKRKEKSKAKSEKEWKDREEGVRKGREMKQKRREDNLAKRKEEKGGKGKKGKSSGGSKGKKKGRPGFEG